MFCLVGLQAEYEKEVKTYLDANDLKPSDLVKPKARKKEVKKPAIAGEIQQLAAQNQQQRYQQPWPLSAAAAAQPSDIKFRTDGQSDDLLVYHVRPDGTQECYVQRGDAGMKAAAAAGDGRQLTERDVLMSTLAEQTGNVTQMQMQLMNARRRVAELEQQNQLLRHLLRDAQLPSRTR